MSDRVCPTCHGRHAAICSDAWHASPVTTAPERVRLEPLDVARNETDPKWTPARRAALARVIARARAFVRCADEFAEDYHAALEEHHAALCDALDADGRAWDDGPDAVVTLPEYTP